MRKEIEKFYKMVIAISILLLFVIGHYGEMINPWIYVISEFALIGIIVKAIYGLADLMVKPNKKKK